MKDSLDAVACHCDSLLIGNVAFDNLQIRIALVLGEIGTTANDETVEHAN